jgi:starch synthase
VKVLFAAAEALPYFRTGGLADVARSLPDSLGGVGVDVRIIHPMYRETAARLPVDLPADAELPVRWRHHEVPTRFLLHEGGDGHADGVLVEAPAFFDTEHPYGAPATDPLALGRRFAFFCRAVVAYARSWGADLIHLNDWQTGLVPAYALVDGLETPSLFAIHNLAYQGNFPPELLGQVDLPYDLYRTENGLEFYRLASFMKAGIALADRLVTVSPNYATEIRTPEYGAGFDGLLRFRRRALHGILNGIDAALWNPGRDPLLTARYNSKNLTGKDAVRAALLEENQLEDGGPLLVMVTRLVHQKGVDLVLNILPELLERGARVIILGDGEPAFSEDLARAEASAPHRVAALHGFDERIAHNVYAGGDFFLMPSRYEPCGLGQMIAQRYGTPPIVRATGGLADTVADGQTGFTFCDPTPQAALRTITRAMDHWRARGWDALRRRCMRLDWSWDRSATLYEQLYRLTLARLAD